ncbi:LOW QUALITY PROTEIN: hypothetical protein MAR_006405, partial [Mya arenaria]
MSTTRSSLSSESTVLNTSSIGRPRLSSSPTSIIRQSLSKRKLHIVSINFQSIQSKNFGVEYTDPDIILASETWLH